MQSSEKRSGVISLIYGFKVWLTQTSVILRSKADFFTQNKNVYDAPSPEFQTLSKESFKYLN